jgi:succinoglycan biosynthesis transport protein ExoP
MVPSADPIIDPPELNAKEFLNIFRRRMVSFVSAFMVVLAVGILSTRLNKPVYQTRAKLLVPAGTSSVSIVDSNNPIATMLAAAQPDSVETQLNVLQSAPVLEEAQRRADIKPKPGVVPPFVRAEAVGSSNTIVITAEGGDPRDAASLANALVDLHLERTDLLATTGLRQTTEFVRKEREKAEKALDAAGNRLLQFRQQHRVVQLAAEREAQSKEYVDLQAKVREGESNITSARAEIQELQARLEKEPRQRVEETLKENPHVAALALQMDELQKQRKRILREHQPTSLAVREVGDQIADLQKEIDAEPKEVPVRTTLPNPNRAALETRLAEREAALQGHQADYNAALAKFNARKGIVDNLGPWEVEQNRLTQERASAQAACTMLSDRLRDLEIRGSAQMRGARVIERAAVPRSPIPPPTAMNLAIFAIVGFCLAIGMVFFQEFLDDRVNSPADVERISGIPMLGRVPLIAADQPKLVHALPSKCQAAEAYRVLRSSIGFAGIDAPIRRLLVTSPSQEEGKTLTSINLATAMAMDGKRVILVDADLRRPGVHPLLNVSNSPGLSEILVGLRSIDEALQQTDIPNLRVICAGAIPPNPAELLGSQSFDRLIDELEHRAEVVIFDSPPCLPVTDPLLISAQTDGVVLVLRVGHTRKAALKHAETLLVSAHARILGAVFNQVQQARSGYHYHYYHGDGYFGDGGGGGNGHRRNGKERRPRLTAGAAAAAIPAEDKEA